MKERRLFLRGDLGVDWTAASLGPSVKVSPRAAGGGGGRNVGPLPVESILLRLQWGERCSAVTNWTSPCTVVLRC